jgi:hypothetical protein
MANLSPEMQSILAQVIQGLDEYTYLEPQDKGVACFVASNPLVNESLKTIETSFLNNMRDLAINVVANAIIPGVMNPALLRTKLVQTGFQLTMEAFKAYKVGSWEEFGKGVMSMAIGEFISRADLLPSGVLKGIMPGDVTDIPGFTSKKVSDEIAKALKDPQRTEMFVRPEKGVGDDYREDTCCRGESQWIIFWDKVGGHLIGVCDGRVPCDFSTLPLNETRKRFVLNRAKKLGWGQNTLRDFILRFAAKVTKKGGGLSVSKFDYCKVAVMSVYQLGMDERSKAMQKAQAG